MVIGVPLRGVRLGVLVPVAETGEPGDTWGTPFKRGGSAEEGLVGLMMVISGGGALAADGSDAIFPFGFGAQLILVRKKCIWKGHRSYCFYLVFTDIRLRYAGRDGVSETVPCCPLGTYAVVCV